MNSIDTYLTQLQTPEFVGVFILMLTTFLIGYFFGVYLEKSKKRALVNRLKKEINTFKIPKKINDIETIFNEVRPRIIEVVNEINTRPTLQAKNKENIAQQARTEFVSYRHKQSTLDFKTLGVGDKNNPDQLTQINGIGPYVEEKLNEIGIYNFTQISRLQIKDITIITDLIDFFPGRIERDLWVNQANALILTY
tara:strand:- start:6188 stop:6772 length:585 start_codon:yes stop_codon:yes gene_type:complete